MNTHYSPLHSNNFTNHLPMFEQSLIRLNLPDELIRQRYKDYISNTPLRDLYDSNTVPTETEQQYLNEYKTYLKILEQEERTTVIHDLLNTMKNSIDAHLFHGIIRLAFAVGHDDDDELAQALAFYKVMGHSDFNFQPTKVAGIPKDDWNQLMELRKNHDLDLSNMSMSEKLDTILKIPELADHITSLNVEEDTEKRIAFVFGLWYLKTRDFYVLHVVNGYNALTSLKPYIDDYDDWLNMFWQMAQVYSLITDERLPVIKIEVKPWSTILEEVTVTTDVHDIKLIYACKELSDRFNLVIFNKIAHIVSHKYWLHQ